MRTITLPLWGYMLVVVAAIALLIYIEQDRLRAQVRAAGRSDSRRRRILQRQLAAWDCAVPMAEPYLRRLLQIAMRWLRAAASFAWRVITAPWRQLSAYVAERRLRKIRGPEPVSPTVWAPVDYSAKRARALEQLGDDWLLATPVNRLTRSQT